MKRKRTHKLRKIDCLSNPELLESRKLFSATETSASEGPALEIEQVLDVGRDYLLNLDAREHLTVSGKRFGSKNVGLPGGGRASPILPGGFRVLGAEAREDSFALHAEKDGTKYQWLGSSDGNLLSSFSGLSNFDNPSLLRAAETPSQEDGTVQNQLPIIFDSSIAAQQPLLTIQGDDFSYEQQLNDDVVQFLDTELVSGRYVISITADNFRVSKSFELEVRDDGTVLLNGNENEVVRFTGYEPTDYHFHYIWEANLNGSGGLEFSSHSEDNQDPNQPTNITASLAALPENIEPLNSINSLKQNEFEVLNLSPDFTKPGMIKRMEVIVEGTQEQDKTVTITIDIDERSSVGPFAEKAVVLFEHPEMLGHAELARARRGAGGTRPYKAYLERIDDSGFKLRGTYMVHKREPINDLRIESITFEDVHGNEHPQTGDHVPFVCSFKNTRSVSVAPELVARPLNVRTEGSYLLMNFELLMETSEFLFTHQQWFDFMDARDWFTERNPNLRTRFTKVGYSFNAGGVGNSSVVLLGETPDGRFLFDVSYKAFIPRRGEYNLEYLTIWDGKRFDIPLDIRIAILQDAFSPRLASPEVQQESISVQAIPTNAISPDGFTQITILFRGQNVSGIRAGVSNPLDKKLIFPYINPEIIESYADGWNDYKAVFELPEGSLPGIWTIDNLVVFNKGASSKYFSYFSRFSND